ncbi:hypothetical protein GOBAR_AA06681 [Gossypium barbadense]|uniref:Uncharacterized protein n=1 Tax=Gossypium barbadense TaxID=3634 RepID=A0A2P5YE70_GOSBA|nr:hypothetical protein GOBAR_AA06681 [Gossypium barbadense]
MIDQNYAKTSPIPLLINFSIFPFGIVEVSHPKFGTYKHTRLGTRACLKPWPNRGGDMAVRYGRVEARHDFPKTRGAINLHGRATLPWVNLIGTQRRGNENPRACQGQGSILFLRHGRVARSFHSVVYIMSSSRGKMAMVLSSKRRRGLGSSSVRATVKVRHPFLKFPQALQEELFQILRARPIATGCCIDWAAVEQVQLADTIRPLLSTDPWERCSKASALPPSIRYLHDILAHTLIGRRESTGVVTTHDAYYLWCMANEHMTNLAYFIAFAICHQIERHRKGVISIGPYVTRLARHFGLLNTVAQSSALTLIGQMSPQGMTTMLHMRMIECRRGTDPPQYCLSNAIDEEDLEDILDGVPPQHEEPSTE